MLTDNRAGIGAVQEPRGQSGHYLLYEMMGQIQGNVELGWIPAHTGALDNELADSVAKEVTGRAESNHA